MPDNVVSASQHAAVVSDLNALKEEVTAAWDYAAGLEQEMAGLFSHKDVLIAFGIGAVFGFVIHWLF